MSGRRAYVILLLAAFATASLQARDCRPETWFHVIGGNCSKAGLTADLEAIRDAGYGGVQFFHGQHGRDETWPGVREPIPCLSAKWDDLVRHAADECARLGLSFRMQNCPGWSMSGGPWIAPSNAMRKLVFVRRDVADGVVPTIPVPVEFADADSDWRDVATLAFPTPAGDDGEELRPVSVKTNGTAQTFRFAAPVTVRTLILPPPGDLHRPWCYAPATHVRFEALDGLPRTVREFDYPAGSWQDDVPFSVACGETASASWRLTLTAPHPFVLPSARFSSAARLDNWEGRSAHVLRGLETGIAPSASAAVRVGEVREVRPGERLGGGRWTVLRFGHVNMKRVNGPAPKEATGWECDKLDPRGIEAHFAGYLGRLVKGPLAGGRLKGMVVDSWECGRQTWTERMEEYFRRKNGYELRPHLPALFGWIVRDEASCDKFLRDWRRTVGELATDNYYGRMGELAQAAGLDVAYETAFGDVAVGDLLAYWKHCDTPMCEFWLPYWPGQGGVGDPSYKPVRPCVSAAHLYGKRRVAAEAFTSMRLGWNENFRELKEQAVRHFARGVTHLVTHTYTHDPRIGGLPPGSSFGSHIGTPFLRGQTWWRYMPSFTAWMRDCGEFLERGHPVVDILRYLGDDVGHKPDENEPFPAGLKIDYLNHDALKCRVTVKDDGFVLPDGMTYRMIWVPDGTYLDEDSRRLLSDLEAKGGRIVRGALRDLPPPQVVCDRPDDLLWYHRTDGEREYFFVAAETNGFRGTVRFRTRQGERPVFLGLASAETRLLTFPGAADDRTEKPSRSERLEDWTVRFPSGWGAPPELRLDRLVAWRDLPGVGEEGRHFSGTATYETEVSVGDPVRRAVLDLGDVRDFARVFVNGSRVADLWSCPYRCEVTPHLKPGVNRIVVEVTSTWYNRLAWDFRRKPEERKTWTTWNLPYRTPGCLSSDAKPELSGLIGPVVLKEEE